MQDGDTDGGEEEDEYPVDPACLALAVVRFSLSTLTRALTTTAVGYADRPWAGAGAGGVASGGTGAAAC